MTHQSTIRLNNGMNALLLSISKRDNQKSMLFKRSIDELFDTVFGHPAPSAWQMVSYEVDLTVELMPSLLKRLNAKKLEIIESDEFSIQDESVFANFKIQHNGLTGQQIVISGWDKQVVRFEPYTSIPLGTNGQRVPSRSISINPYEKMWIHDGESWSIDLLFVGAFIRFIAILSPSMQGMVPAFLQLPEVFQHHLSKSNFKYSFEIDPGYHDPTAPVSYLTGLKALYEKPLFAHEEPKKIRQFLKGVEEKIQGLEKEIGFNLAWTGFEPKDVQTKFQSDQLSIHINSFRLSRPQGVEELFLIAPSFMWK